MVYILEKAQYEGSPHITHVIGMSARNPLGFFYLWLHFPLFVYHAYKGKGCLGLMPGLMSPFAIFMITYWDSHASLMGFLGTKAHLRYVAFVGKFPKALRLFNDTYRESPSTLFINEPWGYGGTIPNLKSIKPKSRV